MAKPNYILFGYPRSGTTWISEILASSGELTYLHEPDNERINIAGLLCKKGHARYTIKENADGVVSLFSKTLNGNFLAHSSYLSKAPLHALGFSVDYLDRFIDHPEVAKQPVNRLKLGLVQGLFGAYKSLGVSRNQGPFLVKTVHSGLMLETLINQLDFIPIISIRHPAAVLRSMKTLNNKDLYRGLEQRSELNEIIPGKYFTRLKDAKSSLEKQALQIGIHHFYWYRLAKKYNILVLKHEDFLVDTANAFEGVFNKLGLTFNNAVLETIKAKNKAGAGYKTSRNAADLIDVWKLGFSQQELNEIKRGYQLLPNPWYTDFERNT